MKSAETVLRDGVYAALAGNISVDVFGANAEPGTGKYVVLEDTNTSPRFTKQYFNNDVVLQLEIVHFQDRAASYKDVDLIYQEIMEILLPTPMNPGFGVEAGWQVVLVQVDTNDFVEKHLEIVVRRIVRLRCTLIQN